MGGVGLGWVSEWYRLGVNLGLSQGLSGLVWGWFRVGLGLVRVGKGWV